MKASRSAAFVVGLATVALAAATAANAQGIPQPNFNINWSNGRLLNADNEPQNWLLPN